MKTLQVVDQVGKIADVAADPIEAIDDDGAEPVRAGGFHHTLEIRPVEVAAGKAFILIDNCCFCGFFAEMETDVRAAELGLIADALALAGELRFAGVDGDCLLCVGQAYTSVVITQA